MKIGIIGSGKIGSTVAKQLVDTDHAVAIANSRGADGAREVAAEVQAEATDIGGAARFGDVVLLAIPYGRYSELPADAFAGKIVVDATNYYPERDGPIEALDAKSATASGLIAEHLSDAKVVKALNTMYYVTLGEEARPDQPREERLTLFVAGDDEDAKRTVSQLLEEIGFAAVDTGSLADGGPLQETDGPLYNKPVLAAEGAELLAGARS